MAKIIRPLLIFLAAAAVFFLWRLVYRRIFYFDALSAAGTVIRAEMRVVGYQRETRYGQGVPVRLLGVDAMLYFNSGDFELGDTVAGMVKVTESARRDFVLNAVAEGELAFTRPERVPAELLPKVWQRAVNDRVDSIWTGDTGAFIKGLLTGHTDDFSPALSESLYATGMTHIASVSGLHISFLTGFIVLIVGNRRHAAFLALPVIILFVAVAGFPPSAVRSAIMAALYLLAPVFKREYDQKRALCFALAVLLIINPDSVADPGLQLSFSSTLGMILFSARLQKGMISGLRISKTGSFGRLGVKLTGYITGALAVSLSAMAFSSPFAAYWFGGVSILAPVTNLLLLWLVSVIFIAALAVLALSLVWWPLAYYVGKAVGIAVAAFFRGVEVFAKIPYGVVSVSQVLLCAWLLLVYALAVVGLVTKCRAAPIICALGSLIPVLLLNSWAINRFSLSISVLDVGQGQCIVLRSVGQTAVIDCGSNSLDSGRLAASRLRAEGENKIDVLLLTHLHDDHANGVESLMQRMPVGEVYLSDTQDEKPGYAYSMVTGTTTFTLGKAELTLIPSDWMGEANERCMTIIAVVEGFSFIVTGDLGASTERWMTRIAELPQNGVIVAGHHGSAGSTSEEWLEAVKPQAAVISVGKNNFGHPSPEVLDRLRGTGVYRTDEMGTINIKVG